MKYEEELKANIESMKSKLEEIQKLKDLKNPETTNELLFFEFSQNNSGGSFHVDDKICHRLFIEAPSYDFAKKKALELGVYFDGCELGLDCGCCGDRWYENEDPVKYEEIQEVDIFSSEEEYFDEWKTSFGEFETAEFPTLKRKSTRGDSNYYVGKVRIKSVEEWVQYCANRWAWTKPDARIFYYDGTIKEIFSKKLN